MALLWISLSFVKYKRGVGNWKTELYAGVVSYRQKPKANCKWLTSLLIYKPTRWLIQHHSSGRGPRPADCSCNGLRETIGKMSSKCRAVLCLAAALACVVVDSKPLEHEVKSKWLIFNAIGLETSITLKVTHFQNAFLGILCNLLALRYLTARKNQYSCMKS